MTFTVGIHEKFVSGLIAVEGRMVVLLDIEKLLAGDVELLDGAAGGRA